MLLVCTVILVALFFAVKIRRKFGSTMVVRNAGMPELGVVMSVGWASIAMRQSRFHSSTSQ